MTQEQMPDFLFSMQELILVLIRRCALCIIGGEISFLVMVAFLAAAIVMVIV
jgi:hypothetical protein